MSIEVNLGEIPTLCLCYQKGNGFEDVKLSD